MLSIKDTHADKYNAALFNHSLRPDIIDDAAPGEGHDTIDRRDGLRSPIAFPLLPDCFTIAWPVFVIVDVSPFLRAGIFLDVFVELIYKWLARTKQ